MIPQCAVNYLVTLAWGRLPWLNPPAVCSNVHSTHDAVVAISDTAVVSTLSRQLVELREQENTLAESAFPSCRMSLYCELHKDAPQVADGQPVSNDANREQFHVALLEDCSFFAHLVLRLWCAKTLSLSHLSEKSWLGYNWRSGFSTTPRPAHRQKSA